MAAMQQSPQYANVPPASQVDGNPTIGAGHPAPVQAPPVSSPQPSTRSNSASGETSSVDKVAKKKDSKS